jgi:hypothetical protein
MAAKWNLSAVFNHYYGTNVLPGPGWRRLKCPEHSDAVASAQINTDKGSWNCFSCDLSEDAIELIKRVEGVREFGRAVAIYEGIAGSLSPEVPRARSSRGRVSHPAGDDGDQLELGGSRRRRRP